MQHQKQLTYLNNKIIQMEKLYKDAERKKSEISIFNILNNPQNFIIVSFMALFAMFLALIIVEGFRTKASNILKPSSWGISLAKIRSKRRMKLFSSTKGSKKWDGERNVD